MNNYYSIAFEDNESLELTFDSWSVELAIADILWHVWRKVVDVFYNRGYLENSNKTQTDSDIKKALTKMFWDDVHLHLLGDKFSGDEKRNTFFINALSNNENTQETLDFCLMHIMNIISAYACDAYLAYCKNPNDYKFMYYLSEANYYRGILVASHAEKVSSQEELKSKMIDLAYKRHEKNRIKENKAKDEIKKIWLSHNWSSYTECADHIHKNNLIEESNYRKIYKLISVVAKKKQ